MLLALASSCGGSTGDDPLAQVLLRDDDVPDGFDAVKGPASGPMTVDDAIASTAADPGDKRRFLETSGFQGGYSRVWTKGDDYVTALAHEFSSERGAKRLVAFEIDQLSTTTSERFEVTDVPGAQGYILSGVKRKGQEPVFCQGVWFAAGTRAFGVSTCGAQPNTTAIAEDLAVEQYDLAST